MEKYRVVVHEVYSEEPVVKMIVNREQKYVIEHLYEHQCFNPDLVLDIMIDDDDWKEFC